MKIAFILFTLLFLSTMTYAQVIVQDEAIRRAKEVAQVANPPMNLDQMLEPQAIYLRNENVWIVDFVQDSPNSTDPDYMVRVEATSGKTPELLVGSQKQRYQSFFEADQNKS